MKPLFVISSANFKAFGFLTKAIVLIVKLRQLEVPRIIITMNNMSNKKYMNYYIYCYIAQ